jgi:hypothetical protein
LKVERNHNSSAPTFFFLLQSGWSCYEIVSFNLMEPSRQY